MKKIYLFAAALLATTNFLFAQTNCNAGNETPVFSFVGPVPGGICVIMPVTAANAGTITDISINNTGQSLANIKFCVYDDNAGNPGNLIASTSAAALTMTAGTFTVPLITPVVIAPGVYYVGAVMDQTASPITIDNTTTTTLYMFGMTFSNAFPANGSSFSSATQNPVNIWMNITCNLSGVQETADNALTMSGYPVPASGVYTMNFHSGNSRSALISVYNANGELVLENATNIPAGESSQQLSLAELAAGIYFIRITDGDGEEMISRKLIKE